MTRIRLPDFKGSGRLAKLIARCEDLIGIAPVQVVEMRQGHRMMLDRRAVTEFWAFYSGRYENAAIERLADFLMPEERFVDVGANVGFFTVAMAVRARGLAARVSSFEPLPANVARLSANLALNGLDGLVEIRPVGLSSSAGVATITLREDFVGGAETGNAAIAIADGLDDRFEQIEIELRRLDDIYDIARDGRIAAMKVDIEGHEDAFLLGARETILASRPVIFMEVNNAFYRRKRASLESACAYRRGAGYAALDTTSAHAAIGDIDALCGVKNIWLVPRDDARASARFGL